MRYGYHAEADLAAQRILAWYSARNGFLENIDHRSGGDGAQWLSRLQLGLRRLLFDCHWTLSRGKRIIMLTHPIGVYINWATYDELSDVVELTEELAMRQLDEVARLAAASNSTTT